MSGAPLTRFVCDKCGRVTITERHTQCIFYYSKDGLGNMDFVTLCPEHRAEWVRWMSDFFEGIEGRF